MIIVCILFRYNNAVTHFEVEEKYVAAQGTFIIVII